jgi:hypothetical protein
MQSKFNLNPIPSKSAFENSPINSEGVKATARETSYASLKLSHREMIN